MRLFDLLPEAVTKYKDFPWYDADVGPGKKIKLKCDWPAAGAGYGRTPAQWSCNYRGFVIQVEGRGGGTWKGVLWDSKKRFKGEVETPIGKKGDVKDYAAFFVNSYLDKTGYFSKVM